MIVVMAGPGAGMRLVRLAKARVAASSSAA
jgi:hypothetical protein